MLRQQPDDPLPLRQLILHNRNTTCHGRLSLIIATIPGSEWFSSHVTKIVTTRTRPARLPMGGSPVLTAMSVISLLEEKALWGQ